MKTAKSRLEIGPAATMMKRCQTGLLAKERFSSSGTDLLVLLLAEHLHVAAQGQGADQVFGLAET